MVKDEDPRVKIKAAEILGEMIDTKAIEQLIKTLSDENSSIVLEVVVALSKIEDVRVPEPLLSTLTMITRKFVMLLQELPERLELPKNLLTFTSLFGILLYLLKQNSYQLIKKQKTRVLLLYTD